MRIGIDIRALAGSEYGGVGEYIKNLLPALFEEGQEHTFHLFFNSYKNSKHFSEQFSYPNVKFHAFSYPNKLFTFFTRYFRRPHIDKLLGGVDIFFSPHFLPAPVSKECKKLITFHDLSFEYFPEYFDRKRRVWHKYISPRREAEQADEIIAVSGYTKEDLVKIYNLSPERIHVVHSGICDSVTNPPATRWNNIKRKYRIKEDYILSLSTIEPRKNIVALIRAFNVLEENPKFKNLYLVIAGATGWKYKKIIKEAKNSPFEEKIIFTGSVEEKEKYVLYKNAKAFVYPSLYEGFGFPPLEAMYAGTPTIVSMLSSLPEVTGGAAILINPYVPKDIAQALSEILSDERLSEALSLAGRKRAEQFAWQKTAQETLKILENVQYKGLDH